MSVYKRPGAETYSFDFEVGGHRFSGDTGKTSKREALAEQERLKRAERARLVPQQSRQGRNLTVDAAFVRYMEEVGNHHVNALTTLASLEWLQPQLGPKRLLRTIDDELVARIVARRRVEKRKVGKVDARDAQRTVSNATVNRTCTEPLRKVILRARLWGCPIAPIDWKTHMLPEPRERVREATVDEEAALLDGLDEGYDAAVQFALLSGCRLGEIVPRGDGEQDPQHQGLVWTRVDFFSRQFTVVGKGNKPRTLPMSGAIFELLWGLKDHHPTAVFTYLARRTDKRKKRVRGVRYPILYSGLQSCWRRALKATGVANYRFHDNRHTAATRTLRQSNLRVVQNLLGHSDVATTAKYAHALTEDIRAALEAASPTHLPADEIAHRLKSLQDKKNSG